MVDVDRRDVVCLHLAAFADARDRDRAPGATTAAGIGDALEVGDTAAGRVRLIEVLADLEADGLVTSEERPVVGHDAPRTVYLPTEASLERAEAVRERVRTRSVVVTNGTTEEVPLSEIDRYLGGERPLVTALARLTDDGRVPVRRPTSEGFVGRADALEAVREAIVGSIERAGRTVVVGGAAGMGKTALVREAVDRVGADRDDPVEARGDCQAGPTAPYGPLQRAFEDVPDGGDLRDTLAEAREAFTPDDPDHLRARRGALFDDVAEALRAASTDRPIVLFLDNLHWADGATLELFAHLATTVTEWVYPVAFVATYRTPAVAAGDHPLPDALDSIERGGNYDEVELGPLDRDGTRTMLADVLGSQRLPDPFVDFVHDRTGGVPLFVRETASHLRTQGIVDPVRDRYPERTDAVTLPQSVTDQIGRRLSVLDDASRELVRLGAVVGEYVPGRVLAAASDLQPATRREHVDLLVASRIWERVPGGTGERGGADADDVRFVSGAVREAVVERLPDETAGEYHERVAEALVAVGDGDGQAARVAHHFEQAGAADRALRYYRRAGDHAKDAYAHEDAVGNYERALALAAASDADDGTRAGITADVAEVHAITGELDAAVATAEDGLELAPEGSRQRCRLLGIRAHNRAAQGAYEPAEDTAQRQRDLAADVGARDLQAEAIRCLGVVAEGRGEYDRARERYERSLSLAREVDDRQAEGTCLKNLGAISLRQGDADDAREYFERSLAIARELGDRRGAARCHNNLGEAARRRGDYDRAREHLERSLAVKRDLGDRHGEARTLGNLGLIAESQGEYDRAREHFEEGLAVFRDLGDRKGETRNLGNLGLIARRRGEYDRAREYFRESLAVARELGDQRTAGTTLYNLGLVARARGEFDRARDLFERSLDVDRELDDRRGEAVRLNSLGLVAVELGDLDGARERLERALELMREYDDRRERANALYGLGEVARRRDDHDRARELFGEALELNEAGGLETGAGRVRVALGRLALARGDVDRAREQAERARDAFAEVGATHRAARGRRLLGRVAAETGAPDEARAHWRAALETFDDVGASPDALATVEHLVGTCRAVGDDERADRWCRRARDLLADAHEAVTARHRDWVERCCPE